VKFIIRSATVSKFSLRKGGCASYCQVNASLIKRKQHTLNK